MLFRYQNSKMKIKFNIRPDLQLLTIKATGIIKKNDLLAFIEYLLEPQTDSITKMLADCRESMFDLTIDEMKQVAHNKVFRKFLEKYSSVSIIILTDKPKETALMIFFSKILVKNMLRIEVYTTLEKARQKLTIPVEMAQLNEILENLAYEFSK